MSSYSRRLLRWTLATLALAVWLALIGGLALMGGPALAGEPTRTPTHLTGHRAGPVSYKSLAGARYSPLGSLYASAFDLRDLGKVSSVKDQAPYGTCWSFAALGSLESCLLAAETWDFSEDDLVWFHGFDYARPGGGNAFMATAQLTRWDAPFTEAQDPYADGVHPDPSSMTLQKHVQDVMFLPPRQNATDNDNIKWALTNHGGVDVDMYFDQSASWASYFNDTTDAYYYGGSFGPNHDVLIVGWDDNYPRTSFSTQPAGDGAFLVKNSWGTSWGDSGYCWVSYYDSRLGYGGSNSVFMAAEPTDNYTHVYQWDPLGYTGSLYYLANSTGWSANKFTAAANEQLKAIGFYTLGPNASYEIYAGPALTSLTSHGSGTLTWFGYHTVDLSTPVSVTSGQPFVVAVKINTPDFRGKKIRPIVLEGPLVNYSSAATAASGQSYEGPDGKTWYDVANEYPNFNVCVKAYTAPAPSDTTPPTTVATGYDAKWHNHPVTVTFTANDNPGGWGVAKTEHKLDAGSWTTGTSVTVAAPAGSANDGAHTVAYRSTDKAGNVEVAKTRRVKIDTRRPVTKAPYPASVHRYAYVRLYYRVNDAAPNAGTADVKIKIKTLAGTVKKTITLDDRRVNTLLSYRFKCTLAKRTYRFSVYATDLAGNKQAKVGRNTLTVR